MNLINKLKKFRRKVNYKKKHIILIKSENIYKKVI